MTPNPPTCGRISVKGTTTIIFRSREKKIAGLALPRPWKVACPAIWNAIIKNPKKKMCMAGAALRISSGSELNTRAMGSGNKKISSQAAAIYTALAMVTKRIAFLTRPYSRAP